MRVLLLVLITLDTDKAALAEVVLRGIIPAFLNNIHASHIDGNTNKMKPKITGYKAVGVKALMTSAKIRPVNAPLRTALFQANFASYRTFSARPSKL